MLREGGGSDRGRPSVQHADVQAFLQVRLEEVVHLQEAGLLVGAVASGSGHLEGLPGQRVHGQLTHGDGPGDFQAHRRHSPGGRGLGGPRAGPRAPSPVPVAWHPGIGRRGGSLKELPFGLESQLLIFLNVNVYSQDAHGLSHNEGQGPKVKRPAVAVMVLFVFITFVAWVACVAGDVDDDAYDVTEA